MEAVCVVVGVVIGGAAAMLFMSHRVRAAEERRQVLDAIEKSESLRLSRGSTWVGRVQQRRAKRASTSGFYGRGGDSGMMSSAFGASMFSGGSDCGSSGGGGFDGGSC